MNISKIVRSAKCGVLGALVAMGMTAVAEPTVTVGEVKTGEPWSKITVNYTLGGTDAKLEYKVAFDVTAKGQTASVTNDAAKLTDGAATKEIDTVALFGKQVVDTKAKVKVTLIAVKPIDYSEPVQLWEGGPFFAQCNVGATKPDEYGILANFDGAANAVTDAMGAGWRVPSDGELKMLAGMNEGDPVCSNVWTTCNNVAGRRFFGMTSGYEDKSIFLPAAGYGSGHNFAGSRGYYWSSDACNSDCAWYISFTGSKVSRTNVLGRGDDLSVRAVRNAK